MDWTVNDALLQADGESWLAGSQCWLRKSTAAPAAWNTVHLKFVHKPADGGVHINLDPWYIGIEEAEGRLTLSRYLGGNFIEAWDIAPEPRDWSVVEVRAETLSIALTINGQTFHCRSDAALPLTSAALYFPENAEFREPEIHVSEHQGNSEVEPRAPVAKSLEFTVDFYDDLILTPFSQEMLDEMFRLMARLGASQAYWIHHGGQGNGFWEGGLAGVNMQRSFELLGPDYLPAAVQSSHKAGLPLVGIFKPFDTAIVHYTSSPPLINATAVALGGGLDQGFAFPGAHPELCQQRRTAPITGRRPREITIRSRWEIVPELAEQLEIYTSNDNANYSAYIGSFAVETDGCALRLRGLDIDAEFIALAFSPELAAQIQNTLPLLVEIRDEAGGVLEFTYGITSRVAWLDEYHLGSHSHYRDFRSHGLNFDCAGHGVPSAVWNSRKRLLELYSPASSHNVLGFAMNGNTHVPAVLSEAEPGAHDWWLSEIESMLDSGVDGVEIRIVNHSNIIDWSLYGFNRPVVEEYRRRYGVDITREEFSREKFRELRGEFFTAFLREASKLTRARGKKFHLHIEDNHQSPASEPCPMEIAMPWREWIVEGLCDGVTLKALNVWANDTAFGREVISLCYAHGIPVSFSPFIHSAFSSSERDVILKSWQESRFDAFNVYEFATLFEFTPDGEVRTVDDAMVAWLKSQTWKQPQVVCAGNS